MHYIIKSNKSNYCLLMLEPFNYVHPMKNASTYPNCSLCCSVSRGILVPELNKTKINKITIKEIIKLYFNFMYIYTTHNTITSSANVGQPTVNKENIYILS